MSPRNRCPSALGVFAPSTPWALAWISAALGTLAAAGCSLNKDQFRPDKVFTRIGGSQGQVIEQKRCLLEVAIITRPLRDKMINESVWKVADVQCVPEEARRSLEANGIRIGKVLGALPADLEAALHAPPPHQVEPISLLPEVGWPSSIRTAESVPELSLLTNLDNRAIARDYEQAAGFLRLTADHDGERGVSLRIVPEIHHGPVKRAYQNVPNPGAYPINQLTISDSQEQDSLLELTSTTVLQPGEVAIVTCDAERENNLGSFLFTLNEANSDRRMQHLVMIWASRNKTGTIEADKLHSSVDRPKESQAAKPDPKSGQPPAADAAESPKKDVGLKTKDQPTPH